MPTPREGESEKDFVSRCIPIRQSEHPGEDTKQSAAVCHSMWRDAQGSKEAKKSEAMDTVLPASFVMKMTKVQRLQNGRIRWQARANSGEPDVFNERFSEEFFDDVIANFYRATEAISRGESPPDNMTHPILDVSHYSLHIPRSQRHLARCGWPTKMWRDGRSLFMQGYFDDTRLGQLAAKAALESPPEKRRASIVVFPDYSLVTKDNDGNKVYGGEGGTGVAWLDSLAMTAHPADPRATMEVKGTMSETTLADDAREVLGDEAEEDIAALEQARALSTATPDGAVVKAEAEEQQEEPEPESTEPEPGDDEPAAEESTSEESEESEEPITMSTLAAVLRDTILPGIGGAVDQRLQPLVARMDTLEQQIAQLSEQEAVKVKTALDSGGNLFFSMFDNSVQRRSTAVTDSGPEEAPSELQSYWAQRYGSEKAG